MQVLTVARWYPSHDSPGRGSFVSDLVRATVEAGVDARVVTFDRVLVRGNRAPQREKERAKARAAYDAVVTPDALFVVPSSVGAGGVPVARLPLVRRPGASDIEELLEDHLDALRPFVRELIEQWRPDVIHAHTGLPDGIVAAAVGREHGIPVVVTEHASTIETVLADPGAVERYRTLLEPDVRLLAVSPSMAARLAGLLGVEPARIGVLPNPVSVEEFSRGDGEPADRDTLLWVGSLGGHKDLDVLLRAFAQLRESRPGLRLRLVGGERKAGDLAGLEALARELRITDAVTFDGWLDRAGAAAAMRRATVFVHPSPSETFGVVAAEAILSGLPVASRRSGGVPWVVALSGGYGAVADDERPTSFAAAVAAVLEGPLAVDAVTARSRLAAELGADVVARKALVHYEEVTERVRSPGSRPVAAPTSSCARARPPTVLAAFSRDQAATYVPDLPGELRSRLVLVVPHALPGAAPDGLDGLGLRLVEADPVPSRGQARRRARLAPFRRSSGPPPSAKSLFVAAVRRAAATVRVDREAVEVVAIDAAAAALLGRLDRTRIRLAPGSLRWLADCWETLPADGAGEGGGEGADASPAPATSYDAMAYWSRLHDRQELSAVGQSALPSDLNTWLYRALERNIRRFVRRNGVLENVDAAFDVGAGSGYWVRVWHDLGVSRVDGCDLAPEAVARLDATYGAGGDQFVTADIGATDSRLPEQQYGLVSVMNVLLHVTEDEPFRQALANVARLVRPGGYLLLVEPALLDPTYERPTRPGAHSRARPLAAYRDPLVAAGLELVTVRGAVAMANNPIEARSPAAYRRYQRWWTWVARTSKSRPDRIRRLGPLLLALDRVALLAGAAPSSKALLLRRGTPSSANSASSSR